MAINTKLILSSTIPGEKGNSNERNLYLCKYLNATEYLSGFGAKAYNDEETFLRNGIQLSYYNFEHPRYKQLEIHSYINSILDLLFNCGER